MKTYLLCPVFLLYSLLLFADGTITLFPRGARAEGMGTTSLVLKDTWSAYNNQAALSFVKSTSAGLYYENKFTVDEMNTSAAAVALPALSGTFGATVAHMGAAEYGENRFGLGYGKQLMKNLSLGVQFNYHLLTFGSGYGNLHAITAEIGLLVEPVDNLFFGAHLFNPTQSKLSTRAEDPVPLVFRLGMGYSFGRNLLLTAEAEKEQSQRMAMKLGVEYFLVSKFCLRMGTLLEPLTTFFGTGWRNNRLAIDFAVSRHHVLGYTPQLSLSYNFGESK